MLICKRCGAPLTENLKYCIRCGLPINSSDPDMPAGGHDNPSGIISAPQKPSYCGKCGAKLPPDCEFCLICGTKAGEAPLPDDDLPLPEPALSGMPSNGACASKSNRRLASFCISLCVVLILSAAALWVSHALPYLTASGKSRVRGAIIYSTSDEKLKIKSPSIDTPEEIVASFNSHQGLFDPPLAQSSLNGRYIAYLNGYIPSGSNPSGDLYILDFGKTPSLDGAAPAGTPVSNDVTNSFFFVNNSSALVYLKANGELCVTDFSGSMALDTGVTSILDHTDTQILFEKSEKKDGTSLSSVYVLTIGKVPEDKTLIDENIIHLADYTPSFEKFVYMREQSGGHRDIIAYDVKSQSRRTLAVGADTIISADASASTALYQTTAVNTLRYENLILDDYLQADDALEEPDIEDYPLLSEYFDKNGTDAAATEALDQNEDLAEENVQFGLIIEAYDNKLERDELRAAVKAEIAEFVKENPTLYDLHLTRDGSPVRLAEGSYKPFDNAAFDVASGISVWTFTGWKGIHKIPLADYKNMTAQTSLIEYLSLNMSDNLYICRQGSSPSSIYIGDSQFYSGGWKLTAKADGIYFAMGAGTPLKNHPDNACSLYYAPISGGKTGNIIMVDEYVAGIGEMLDGDRLIYYKERVNDICDLYLVNGSSSQKAGEDITLSNGFFIVENDNKTLLYCEHFNSQKQSGDLFMLTKQTRQIAGEVCRIYYKNDNLIYFMRGFNNGNAELYSFTNSGLTRIDENVVAVMQ